MKRSTPVIIAAVAFAAFLAIEVAILWRNTESADWVERGDREVGEMVDRLTFIDTADAFAAGKMQHVAISKDDGPAQIVLSAGPLVKGFPLDGTWMSPATRADFPFTEVVPSWNVFTPEQTGVFFSIRTRDLASREWTPWLRIGAWGRTTNKARRDECKFGAIDVDTLYLNRPADAYQIRATLQRFMFDATINPSIRRIAVTYSGRLDESSAWAKSMHPTPPDGWARTLDVPYRPQHDNAHAVTGMTCSPTSVSMVLDYWGVGRSTPQ